MIVEELMETAARAHGCLDEDMRRAVIKFVKSRWNPDGGVRGRNGGSDLYYTVFAAMCLRALKGRLPLIRLWSYLRSFGEGGSLDIVHLFSLIRLRSVFPMSQTTRDRFMETLEAKQADSASDMFLKVVMAEYLNRNDHPDAHLHISDSETTSDLAAAVIVNQQPNPFAEKILVRRYCETGGFLATATATAPCLEATAKALYALRVLGVDLSPMRAPCLGFIESLRRTEGGYVAHGTDDVADTESTFYALFSIGCLGR